MMMMIVMITMMEMIMMVMMRPIMMVIMMTMMMIEIRHSFRIVLAMLVKLMMN